MENAPKSPIPALVFRNCSAVVAKLKLERLSGVPVDLNHNRRTQDWKFPAMDLAVSANPEISQFPASYDLPRQISTGGSDGRPPLIHHPTRPIGTTSRSSLIHSRQASLNGLSIRESLIDLDMGLPEGAASSARPSTANSDTGSTFSDQIAVGKTRFPVRPAIARGFARGYY
jgi:hypothetical protein